MNKVGAEEGVMVPPDKVEVVTVPVPPGGEKHELRRALSGERGGRAPARVFAWRSFSRHHQT